MCFTARSIAPLFALLVGCNAVLGISDHERADENEAGAGGKSALRGGGSGMAGRAVNTGGRGSAFGGSTASGGGNEIAGEGGGLPTSGEGSGVDAGGSSGADGAHGGRGTATFGGASGASGSGTSSGGNVARGDGSSAFGGASSANGGSIGANGGSIGSGAGSLGASGGAPSNVCNPACPSSKLCENNKCIECRNSERSCASDGTPLLCVANVWSKQAACSGVTPVCSNGTCVGTRLIGGIVAVQGALSRGSVRLVEQSLDIAAPTCSTSAGKCVVGGIRP